jgi:hypothetical protein
MLVNLIVATTITLTATNRSNFTPYLGASSRLFFLRLIYLSSVAGSRYFDITLLAPSREYLRHLHHSSDNYSCHPHCRLELTATCRDYIPSSSRLTSHIRAPLRTRRSLNIIYHIILYRYYRTNPRAMINVAY